MPLSYIFGFTLRGSEHHNDRYIHEIVREWPDLYASVPGVTGSALFGNAFALAGRYTYHYRIDLKDFTGLAEIDKAIKGDRRFQKARESWFAHRGDVRARLLQRDSAGEYLSYRSNGEGLVHLVIPHGGDFRFANKGALGTETLRGVFQSAQRESSAETWVRIRDVSALNDIQESFGGNGGASLLGEIREVNGVLHAGA